MKISAVVFDLDGTLLDTLMDLNEACNYALGVYHYEPIRLEETRMFIGNGIHKLIERALKGRLEQVEKVFTTFKEYYQKNYNTYTKAYPGVNELLLYCQQHNLKLAVLSNKAQSVLDLLCIAHFPQVFDMILGDQFGLKKKPATDGLERICQELSINMQDILYIGDSDVDVETVKNAGCHGAFVSYGFRSEEVLKKAGAQQIFKNPFDVMKWLEVIL